MKKLFVVFAALLFVIGLTAGAAYADHNAGHFKGIFEAPLMDSGGQVAGSEGKIGALAEYKVEIPSVAAGTYELCLRFATSLGAAANDVFVANVVVADEGGGVGEFKSVGNLVTTATVTDPDDIYRPAFRVREDNSNDCTDTIRFESGLHVDKP